MPKRPEELYADLTPWQRELADKLLASQRRGERFIFTIPKTAGRSAIRRYAEAMTADRHESPARPPSNSGWVHQPERHCRLATKHIGAPTHAYQKGFLRVLSSAEMAEYQGITVPHNHVTVSVDEVLGRRARDEEMTLVRHDFDMHDAEEDNHQPGRIRNLFLPLHLPRGTTGICDCKSDETEVVEADGFRWSKKKVQS
jgi:hypothetical protein